MASTTPFCMTTKDLIQSAAMKSMGVTGQQSRLSMPIPTGQAGQPHHLFIACPTFSRPAQPTVFYAPNVLLRMAISGAFIELRAIVPADLGSSHKPDEAIGTDSMPPGLDAEQERQHFERLWELYDIVVPAFFGLDAPSAMPLHTAAREARELFNLLAEAPLRPYYQALGQGFFGWLGQTAR